LIVCASALAVANAGGRPDGSFGLRWRALNYRWSQGGRIPFRDGRRLFAQGRSRPAGGRLSGQPPWSRAPTMAPAPLRRPVVGRPCSSYRAPIPSNPICERRGPLVWAACWAEARREIIQFANTGCRPRTSPPARRHHAPEQLAAVLGPADLVVNDHWNCPSTRELNCMSPRARPNLDERSLAVARRGSRLGNQHP